MGATICKGAWAALSTGQKAATAAALNSQELKALKAGCGEKASHIYAGGASCRGCLATWSAAALAENAAAEALLARMQAHTGTIRTLEGATA